MLLPQPGNQLLDGTAAWPADDVPDEKQFHAANTTARTKAGKLIWLAGTCGLAWCHCAALGQW